MVIKQARKLKKIEDEEWKELPGSKGLYFISNYGRVKSFAYDKVNGQLLKTHNARGYLAINLSKSYKFSRMIHRLVAETWLENADPLCTHVIHKDWNLKNNHYLNLAWVTKDEVAERASQYMKKKNANPDKLQLITSSKLNAEDVKHIKSMLGRGITQNKIAKMFCVSEMQITRIKRGENWGYVQPEKIA